MSTSGVSGPPLCVSTCGATWNSVLLGKGGSRVASQLPPGFTRVEGCSHPGLLRRVQNNSPEFLKCLHQPTACSSNSPQTPSVVAGARQSNTVTGAASSGELWPRLSLKAAGGGGGDEAGSACHRGGTSQSSLGHTPPPPPEPHPRCNGMEWAWGQTRQQPSLGPGPPWSVPICSGPVSSVRGVGLLISGDFTERP